MRSIAQSATAGLAVQRDTAVRRVLNSKNEGRMNPSMHYFEVLESTDIQGRIITTWHPLCRFSIFVLHTSSCWFCLFGLIFYVWFKCNSYRICTNTIRFNNIFDEFAQMQQSGGDESSGWTTAAVAVAWAVAVAGGVGFAYYWWSSQVRTHHKKRRGKNRNALS